MTPSPQQSPPQRNALLAARRSWRFALLAAVASAALVLSPLTLQAEADDRLPGDPTSTDAPSDEPTETSGSADPSEPTTPTPDQPTDEPTDQPTDQPTDEPTDEPTEEPTDAESDVPAKPGQDIGDRQTSRLSSATRSTRSKGPAPAISGRSTRGTGT